MGVGTSDESMLENEKADIYVIYAMDAIIM